MSDRPVLVEILRGGVVESRHRGSAAVCDAAGRLVTGWGDASEPVFPRSAVKPLQALPLLETGAADRFHLEDSHVALACASHGGEPEHVARVADWLATIGLAASALECGAHWPSHEDSAHALARGGGTPCALHNNCSGKHSGFLTTALALGEAPAGYIAPQHPVQRRVTLALGEMMGLDLDHAPWGVDGCGIPSFAVPLTALATGMARLADPARLGAVRAAACDRIRMAMRAHPFLVAASGRPCTALLQALPEVVVKAGAEGVYAAALPGRGLGVAVKIEDGGGRAAAVALIALFDQLGVLDDGARTALAAWARPPVHNVAGRVVGEIRPAEVMPRAG